MDLLRRYPLCRKMSGETIPLSEEKQPTVDINGDIIVSGNKVSSANAPANNSGVRPGEMGAGDIFFMLLMPITSVVSIVLVVWVAVEPTYGTGPPPAVMPVAGGLGAFHTLWALRNFFLDGNKKERGMVTMGLVALGSVLDATVDSVLGHVVALVGALGVVLSFAAVCFLFPFTKLCGGKSNEELAARRSKPVVWAKILRGYMLAELLIWVVITALLVDGAVNWESPDAANAKAAPGKVWVECGSACPNVCGQSPAQSCIEMCMEPGWFCAGDTSWWDEASGSCVSAAACPPAPSGKVWLECGSSCPSVCGQPVADVCTMVCVTGWFCTGATPWWDPNSTTCVSALGCST